MTRTDTTDTFNLLSITDLDPCRKGFNEALEWAASEGLAPAAVPLSPAVFARALRGIPSCVNWAIEKGALFPDAVLSDAHRNAAIAEGVGYWYACHVDKVPRDDTRNAAIAEGRSYWYALEVDKVPRDDTRNAANAEGRGYLYARYIDLHPTD